jgi:hypothetical protein
MGKRRRRTFTQEQLRELLDYDPTTGMFNWKVNRGPVKIGDAAGCEGHHSYIVIMVLGRLYYAHRLAWFWMTGVWPASEIDHEDGDGGNNRFANLREASHAENHQNRGRENRPKKTSQFTGVCWSPETDKWRSYITLNGRFHGLGYFDREDEARAAYLSAKLNLHTFQPTPRAA